MLRLCLSHHLKLERGIVLCLNPVSPSLPLERKTKRREMKSKILYFYLFFSLVCVCVHMCESVGVCINTWVQVSEEAKTQYWLPWG